MIETCRPSLVSYKNPSVKTAHYVFVVTQHTDGNQLFCFIVDTIPRGEIFVRDCTDTTISVLWAPIPTENSYFLTITPANADTNQASFSNTDQLEYIFTGLSQGTEYTLSVTTGQGQSFMTTKTTSKDVLKNVINNFGFNATSPCADW